MFVAKENTAALERMNDLIAAGKVQPPQMHTHPLVEAATAVNALEAAATSGRLVLTV